MNIFEQASRCALRFESDRGDLSVEQLWGMPLQSKNKFDIDTIAIKVISDLRELSVESLLKNNHSEARTTLELKLEILKHIVAAKEDEIAMRTRRQAASAQRERLVTLLGEKQDESLKGLSIEELTARIKELE